MKRFKVFAKKPNPFQSEYYCFYCKDMEPLKYLYYKDEKNRLIGLGLDRWVYCPHCKRKYKISIFGINEQELNCVVVEK